MNRPQASTWNLSVQRQFGKDWLVSASYLGSTTTHIWMQEQGNPARIISPLPPGGAATCGGRGETWIGPCDPCCGTGESLFHHPVRVSVPAGVADGARFRFRVSSPDAPSVRVELRVAIRA